MSKIDKTIRKITDVVIGMRLTGEAKNSYLRGYYDGLAEEVRFRCSFESFTELVEQTLSNIAERDGVTTLKFP